MSDHLHRWGVVYGLLAVAAGAQCSVLANTMLRFLSEIPLLQIMQLRFLCQFAITVLVVCGMRTVGHPLRFFGPSDQRHVLVARAICFSSGLCCFWASMKYLPIGEATAMAYFSPILCGLIAKIVLDEKLGASFGVQALVSCIGVLMVVLPPPGNHGKAETSRVPGMCLAAGAAWLFAINQCLTRMLKNTHPLEVQLWQDAVTAFILCPGALLVHAEPINWNRWDVTAVQELSVFTFAGFTAAFLFISGFLLAPASKATLFTYTEVPTSFLVQTLVFQQQPLPIQAVGASFVVMAAAVRLWNEAADTACEAKKHDLPTGSRGDEEYASEAENHPLLEDSRASTEAQRNA